MSLPEWLYAIALVSYQLGAAWSLRSDGARPAVLIMAAALAADVGITVMSAIGLPAFDMGASGRNTAINIGAISGLLVWLLGAALLLVRWRGSRAAFHVLTVCTQLCWLLSYLAFTFGVHADPMV